EFSRNSTCTATRKRLLASVDPHTYLWDSMSKLHHSIPGFILFHTPSHNYFQIQKYQDTGKKCQVLNFPKVEQNHIFEYFKQSLSRNFLFCNCPASTFR